MPIDTMVTTRQAPAELRLVRPSASRIKGGRGELFVDNHLAPEPLVLPNSERVVVPAGQTLTLPTLTCGHCNAVTVLNPQRTRARQFCRRCVSYVCDKPGCDPAAGCNYIQECIDLAQTHDGDWLGRDALGTPTFDPRVRDASRIH